MSTTVAKRLLGAAGGLVIDRLVGEPPAAVHPVAAFGDVMGRVEHTVYADTRRAGVGYTAAGLALGAGAGAVVGSTTAVVAVTAAGRMLRGQADEIRGHLDAEDLDAPARRFPRWSGAIRAGWTRRASLPRWSSRWPRTRSTRSSLPRSGVPRAAHSVRPPTARSTRWMPWSATAHEGTSASAGAVPASTISPRTSRPGSPRSSSVSRGHDAGEPSGGVVTRDAKLHPSPNAGVAEAAFAGALGIELGGPLRYGTREESRPRLGDGRRPAAGDIDRAVQLADHVELLLAAALVSGAALALAIPRPRQDGDVDEGATR